jgi:hypothetical protein
MTIQYRLLGLAGILALNVIFSLLAIAAYGHFSNTPTFFFAGCASAVLFPVITYFVIRQCFHAFADVFATFMIAICCGLTILVFNVFGPVFIDRSISYHLAFYAAENGSVDEATFIDHFSCGVFEKRMHDAQLAGFINRRADGRYEPTHKALIFTKVMLTMGWFTNSLEEYKSMKSFGQKFGDGKAQSCVPEGKSATLSSH